MLVRAAPASSSCDAALRHPPRQRSRPGVAIALDGLPLGAQSWERRQGPGTIRARRPASEPPPRSTARGWHVASTPTLSPASRPPSPDPRHEPPPFDPSRPRPRPAASPRSRAAPPPSGSDDRRPARSAPWTEAATQRAGRDTLHHGGTERHGGGTERSSAQRSRCTATSALTSSRAPTGGALSTGFGCEGLPSPRRSPSTWSTKPCWCPPPTGCTCSSRRVIVEIKAVDQVTRIHEGPAAHVSPPLGPQVLSSTSRSSS